MKRIQTAAVLVLLIAVGIACGDGKKAEPEAGDFTEILSRADHFCSMGDVAGARSLLDGILAEQADSFPALYRLGVLWIYENPPKGMEFLREAEAIDPSHPGPPVFTGLARILLSEFQNADKDLARGFALAEAQTPALPDTGDRVRLALTALRSGNAAAAYDTLAKVLETETNNPVLWFWYARAAYAASAPEEAGAAIERALVLHPEFPEALVFQARIHLDRGSPDLARASLESSLTLRPGLAAAHNLLGVLSMRDSAFRKACRHFWDATLADPTAPEHLQNLGQTFIQMFLAEQGAEHLRYFSALNAFVQTRRTRAAAGSG